MSREAKLKEEINNLRGILVAMFTLMIMVITGRVMDGFGFPVVALVVLTSLWAYDKMSSKLTDLEKE